MKKNILYLVVLFLYISCDNSSNEIVPTNDIKDVTILDFSTNIKENSTIGFEIGSISFDANEKEYTFSLVNENPIGALEINEKTAKLTVKDSSLFDYELYPIIQAEVVMSDGNESKSAMISIMLIDEEEDESPLSFFNVSNFTTNVDENIESNSVIGNIDANSNVKELTYTLKSVYPENAIIVDQNNGAIIVKEEKLFNYELYPVVNAVVEVSNEDEVKQSKVTINLNDVPENSVKYMELEGVKYSLDRVEMEFNNRRTTSRRHKAWDISFYSENVSLDSSGFKGIGNYLTFRIYSLSDINNTTIYTERNLSPRQNHFFEDTMFVIANHDFSTRLPSDFRKDIQEGIIRFKRTLKTGITYQFEIDFILTFVDGTTLHGTYHDEGVDLSER